MLGWRGAT